MKDRLVQGKEDHVRPRILCQETLYWPAFLKLFQIPRRKAQHSGSSIHADYEYLNHFFPAHPDLPKFYVKYLKITLYSCF